MEIRIIAESDVIQAVKAAVPDSVITEPPDDDALALELLPAISLPLASLLKLARAIYTNIRPYISARPEMELEIEGPGGKIKLKMRNVTEQLLASTAQKVMSQRQHVRRKA